MPSCTRNFATRASVQPADIGENITTHGVDLLKLPTGTRLHLGRSAVVEITGLRNPCIQIDTFQQGLMAATLDRDAEGNLVRKAGVMSIVLADGDMQAGRRHPRRTAGRAARSAAAGVTSGHSRLRRLGDRDPPYFRSHSTDFSYASRLRRYSTRRTSAYDNN